MSIETPKIADFFTMFDPRFVEQTKTNFMIVSLVILLILITVGVLIYFLMRTNEKMKTLRMEHEAIKTDMETIRGEIDRLTVEMDQLKQVATAPKRTRTKKEEAPSEDTTQEEPTVEAKPKRRGRPKKAKAADASQEAKPEISEASTVDSESK